MPHRSITITTNTTTELVRPVRRSSADSWSATLGFSGTFGSGTYSLQYSPDGGTTKITMTDLTGAAYAITAATVISISLYCSSSPITGKEPIIYVVSSGSSGANVVVNCQDNV